MFLLFHAPSSKSISASHAHSADCSLTILGHLSALSAIVCSSYNSPRLSELASKTSNQGTIPAFAIIALVFYRLFIIFALADVLWFLHLFYFAHSLRDFIPWLECNIIGNFHSSYFRCYYC